MTLILGNTTSTRFIIICYGVSIVSDRLLVTRISWSQSPTSSASLAGIIFLLVCLLRRDTSATSPISLIILKFLILTAWVSTYIAPTLRSDLLSSRRPRILVSWLLRSILVFIVEDIVLLVTIRRRRLLRLPRNYLWLVSSLIMLVVIIWLTTAHFLIAFWVITFLVIIFLILFFVLLIWFRWARCFTLGLLVLVRGLTV